MKYSTLQKNSIPKTIHYCWFGGGEKSELILKCIATWKKYLPDYKIIEWNESNFDINCNPFVKRAYAEKKWAYVSDYARLFALYEEGGIYLDTDVEITDSLDTFLHHNAFTGFETQYMPFTAVLGATPKNDWILELLSIYTDIEFEDSEGNFILKTNTQHVSSILINKYHVKTNNKLQSLSNGLTIYPSSHFFNPISNEPNFAIHHCDGSWITGNKKTIRTVIKKLFGNKIFLSLMSVKSKLLFGLKLKRR